MIWEESWRQTDWTDTEVTVRYCDEPAIALTSCLLAGMHHRSSRMSRMSASAVGMTIHGVLLVAFLSGMTWWIVYSRRHPNAPAPWWVSATASLLRTGAEIVRALLCALLVFVILWSLLSWATHAIATGHLTPLSPKTSPWRRLMLGLPFRPWNRYAIGLLYVALTAMVFSVLHWQVRIMKGER